MAHRRVRRSPFKEKSPFKFAPKTRTFKEFINHKPPKKITEKSNSTSIVQQQQKSQFLSIIDEVGDKHSRPKRQAAPFLELCNTRSEFVSPKAALNNQGNWKYVVNLEDTQYTQLVQSVVCTSTQCSSICRLPSGYTSRCEQRYVQRRLVSLEETGQRLETDLFWLPSCCVCTINTTN